MQLVNTLDIPITVLTFNVGDTVQLISYKRYAAPAGSRIYVNAHDNGRCKLRAEWPHGGRELGVHAENDVVAVTPPTVPPRFDRDTEGTSTGDSVRDFLIENWEKTNWYRVELPARRQGRDQQPY
jgi:hypothetical protein